MKNWSTIVEKNRMVRRVPIERIGFRPEGGKKMRKTVFGGIGLAVLLGALLFAVGAKDASAEVSVSINIGPPPIVVAEPPEVVLIPRTQVYFVPGGIDIFFYGGYWWSPRGDRWYRSKAYNGPWGVVNRRNVPAGVRGVPKDFRGRYEREPRIPYGQWKKGPKHHVKEDRRERKAEHREMKEHERDRMRHDGGKKGHDGGKKGRDEKEVRHGQGRDRN